MASTQLTVTALCYSMLLRNSTSAAESVKDT